MELHSAQELVRCTFAQHVVKTSSEVDVQVVEHQMNAASLGIRVGQQVADEDHEVGLAPSLCDRDGPLPGFGLYGHEQIGRAVTRVLVVHFFGLREFIGSGARL
ncbi:MAG: hypothetical protein L6414_11490 [Hydrogenophaga sp.]|nr:hypothetical protein [Hydrogenophaga sp.]MCG2656069.1 hypothetical protein [Hydrogenophaga sp.]